MSGLMVTVEATVALTHAEVQAIVEDHGIDLLHIKGPALDASLRRPWPEAAGGRRRTSIDADVLVRPRHVERLSEALRSHGWRRLYDFADGSAFEHAATWSRRDLASLDVHRHFPGFEADPECSFDLLWSTRETGDIAGMACAVPALEAQRLIVLIHAARGRSPRDRDDRARAWESIGDAERARIDALAEPLGARVALYASTGRLDLVRGERTYPLWSHLTSGDPSPSALWWARVRSAPTWRSGARLGMRMILPNRRRMETRLGRLPTRGELARAYQAQAKMAFAAVRRSARARRRRAR